MPKVEIGGARGTGSASHCDTSAMGTTIAAMPATRPTVSDALAFSYFFFVLQINLLKKN